MSDDLAEIYLREIRFRFAAQKQLADEALAQVARPLWLARLSPDENSMAIIMKHVGGNLEARWVNPLGSDGEESRDRDAEFEQTPEETAESALEAWDRGWHTALRTLHALAPSDLTRSVSIRGESLLLIEALGRNLAHTAQHVGQLVLLARHFAAANWHTLSVPRGQSRGFRPPRATRAT
ncbi:MAG: DUF1572 family protein [Vicinamibacterales bacterium]